MPASFTISKTGLTTTKDQPNWDDDDVDMIIEWAKATYLNDDGTTPGPSAALNRCMKAAQQGIVDAARKFKKDSDIGAVPPAPEIPID